MLYWLDLFGTGVFAVSGALAAGRKQFDLFGVVVVGLVTAIGGGTLRDVLLGVHPVFWVSDPTYIVVAAGAALATFVVARYGPRRWRLLLVADAFGLAVFAVIGTERASNLEVCGLVAVVMGAMTAAAGGVVRDLLTGEVPLIFQREIYATAALAGAALLVIPGLPLDGARVPLAVAATFAIRLAAIRWRLSLPVFAAPARADDDPELPSAPAP